MNVSTRDPKVFGKALKEAARQLDFAQSTAINRSAKRIQAALVEHANVVFIVRKKSFINRAFKIKPFAKKSLPVAVLKVEPPGGRARADIVTRHQYSGQREPFDSRALLVPQKARTNPRRKVSKTQMPSAFNFRRVSSRGTHEIYRGDKRAFMIRRADGSGWIFRRRRKGRHGTFKGADVLWSLETSTPIEGVLDFFQISERIFARSFPGDFAAAYRRALETSRGYR